MNFTVFITLIFEICS